MPAPLAKCCASAITISYGSNLTFTEEESRSATRDRKKTMRINGKRIYLKLLSPDDVGENYCRWMNDKEVTQYLESRWRSYSLEDLKVYVKNLDQGRTNFMFGIFLNQTREHIGNIKIGNIDQRHKFGDIGLVIGIKKEWGKGYATESIGMATDYAFNKIGLNKLIAGIYENNLGSYYAFLKCGYREVGRLKKHRFFKNNFIDEILVEKCREGL